MKVKDYENFVSAQAHVPLDNEAYSVIGLCGEAGEVAEWFKKVKMRAKVSSLTEKDLLSELGDVIHYVARIAIQHGWTLKDCMYENYEKISGRSKCVSA